jgi:hypothetical protein
MKNARGSESEPRAEVLSLQAVSLFSEAAF